eukprot:UN28657
MPPLQRYLSRSNKKSTSQNNQNSTGRERDYYFDRDNYGPSSFVYFDVLFGMGCLDVTETEDLKNEKKEACVEIQSYWKSHTDRKNINKELQQPKKKIKIDTITVKTKDNTFWLGENHRKQILTGENEMFDLKQEVFNQILSEKDNLINNSSNFEECIDQISDRIDYIYYINSINGDEVRELKDSLRLEFETSWDTTKTKSKNEMSKKTDDGKRTENTDNQKRAMLTQNHNKIMILGLFVGLLSTLTDFMLIIKWFQINFALGYGLMIPFYCINVLGGFGVVLSLSSERNCLWLFIGILLSLLGWARELLFVESLFGDIATDIYRGFAYVENIFVGMPLTMIQMYFLVDSKQTEKYNQSRNTSACIYIII